LRPLTLRSFEAALLLVSEVLTGFAPPNIEAALLLGSVLFAWAGSDGVVDTALHLVGKALTGAALRSIEAALNHVGVALRR